MRLLARYLLRECLVALGFCLSAFLMFWVASDLITNLHRFQARRLHGGDVLAVYFFRLPEFLPTAIPVALLLALLYVITTHARHNEITAIRAAGVSLFRLSLPYFGVAIAAGAILFVVNEFVAPFASERADDIYESRRVKASDRKLKKNFSFTNAREKRNWHIGIYNRETRELIAPTVNWHMPDGSARSILAESARFRNGVWTFHQVRDFRRAPGSNSVTVLYQTNVMSFPEFSETPAVINSELSINDRFGDQGGTRQADIPVRIILDYLRLHPKPEPAVKAWLYTKLHGRFAAPATCLVVVLLAVPFAAGSGRRNVFVGVAASIVIFFTYYIFQQFGFAFGEAGRVPAWIGAWFPNIVAGIIGLALMLRVR